MAAAAVCRRGRSAAGHSHAPKRAEIRPNRGTGKTTCAKILAKAVNCLHPADGDPCGECEICRGIDSGAVTDVTEIDAASNNGVDNIRDLREEVQFTPAEAKYRVYIIDEVHMLSPGAFNALLKTLEEPPAHVVFILATTEVHKLPATILSRCQRFDFHRIAPEAIADRLAYVCAHENAEIDREAALLIARLSDGALRDALSLLDQCLGRSAHVTEDVVTEAAGLAGQDHLFALTDAIIAKLSARQTPVVFILWGAHAQSKVTLIDTHRHHIIKSPHPSPLSASRGFFGSRPFSRANAYLIQDGLDPIDWCRL